jgi:iron complex transport system ATP-binding protein
MDLARRETRRRNIVTLVVVHDINIALRHADHVLMLKAGQLLGDGTLAAVITPETLAAVYGVRGRIEPCSQGVRQVLTAWWTARPDRGAGRFVRPRPPA